MVVLKVETRIGIILPKDETPALSGAGGEVCLVAAGPDIDPAPACTTLHYYNPPGC